MSSKGWHASLTARYASVRLTRHNSCIFDPQINDPSKHSTTRLVSLLVRLLLRAHVCLYSTVQQLLLQAVCLAFVQFSFSPIIQHACTFYLGLPLRYQYQINHFRSSFNEQEAPLTLRAQRRRCRNIKGNPKYLGASLAQGHAHVFLWYGCDFMMGLGKPKLCTKFEIASFSHCVNIERKPQILGLSLIHI